MSSSGDAKKKLLPGNRMKGPSVLTSDDGAIDDSAVAFE
jgi:hypothetical protein